MNIMFYLGGITLDILRLILLALIGSLIGWMTNRVAIKMLFKPVKPVKILFFTLQGVMSKRQHEIAKSIGEIVENQFLSLPELIEQMVTMDDIEGVKSKIREKLSDIAKQYIPPMFMSMVGGQITNLIDSFINKEGETILRDFLKEVENKANEKINICKMVEDKINSLNFGEFEEIVLKIAKKELHHIEYIGAVLGFIIGLIQGLIVIVV